LMKASSRALDIVQIWGWYSSPLKLGLFIDSSIVPYWITKMPTSIFKWFVRITIVLGSTFWCRIVKNQMARTKSS
jgi:hypothetical protein